MKETTFFFHLGISRPGDRLLICLKIMQCTAFLYSKIEKDYLYFSFNAIKNFTDSGMSTEFLFIIVLKIPSDMTATLAATPHMSKAVDRQACNTALGIPLRRNNASVHKLGLKK